MSSLFLPMSSSSAKTSGKQLKVLHKKSLVHVFSSKIILNYFSVLFCLLVILR
jgi:hypothetical protein